MLSVHGEIRVATEPILEEANGTVVVKFRGASSELVKSDSAEKKWHNHYFDFVAWGSAAQFIKDKCGKGTDLSVEAIPRENRWVGPDGKNKSKTFFRLQRFSILANKTKSEEIATEEVATTDAPF